MRLLAFSALIGLAPVALAGGFGPWTFGMNAAQIRAVKSNGPYRSFTNGDLETYNAKFCGQKENVQFYLKDGHLWRIVVVTYEGKSLDQAAKQWMATYNCLKKLHGTVETPGLKAGNVQALGHQAEALVGKGTKVQMAPVAREKGLFIFSSFDSYVVKGVRIYRVWVNYDRPSS